jgi:drug/metabolite transporter (DMT)-like permease
MSNIPWIPILLIGGLLLLELIFNHLILKNEKYRKIKFILFFIIAGIVLILSLINGDSSQIQNAILFFTGVLFMLFYKKKNILRS